MLRYCVQKKYSAGALLAALVLWATASVAQFVNPSNPPPFSNPLRPAPAGPQGVIRTDPALPVMLRWRQEEFAPANYFLLCVYVRATSDCASTPLRWLQSSTTIPRAAVTRSYASGSPVVTAYDYTFSVLLPPEMIDQQVDWSVAACGSEKESSCTFVTTPVWFSTHNLTAFNIGNDSTSEMLDVQGEVLNQGMKSSGPFVTVLSVYHAVVDDDTDLCLTDVTKVGNPYAFILTPEGNFYDISSLPRDANDKPDASQLSVAAITYGFNPVTSHSSFYDIPPGVIAEVVQVQDGLPDEFSILARATTLMVDTGDALTEYDESDNFKVECHIIYGPGK